MVNKNVHRQFSNIDTYLDMLSSFKFSDVIQKTTWVACFLILHFFAVSYLTYQPVSVCDAAMFSQPIGRLFANLYPHMMFFLSRFNTPHNCWLTDPIFNVIFNVVYLLEYSKSLYERALYPYAQIMMLGKCHGDTIPRKNEYTYINQTRLKRI
jgi:hypothetical protein